MAMSAALRKIGARALEYGAVFVAYGATARIGLSFDALGGIATTVWPPTGIALAALVLRGPRLWPAVVAAALAVNAATGIPLWSAAIIAVGNTLEALAGATLLLRFGFDARLQRVRDVLLLVGPAALVSTLISASFGLASAALAHVRPAESYAAFWSVWWVGDAMGDLLVAPLICVWVTQARLSRQALRWLEAILLGVALTALSLVMFQHMIPVRAIQLMRGTYAIVPLLIWAALRFEQRGVTAALVLVGALAVTYGSSAGGLFVAPTPHERLLMVQCYMAVTTVSMLTLAAALSERRAAIGVRDEFISIASHELKTPLTALKLRLGSAMRMRGERTDAMLPDDEKITRAIAGANTAANRLVSLVDDLLDVSRLTAGRLVLHLEPVDLNELVRDVVGRLRETAAEAGSAIELHIPAPIVGRWDRNRIEQVVTNLITNAIKYGQARPITLSAQATGEGMQLQVKDGGVGIARADQARIFQAFERGSNPSRVGGLGLGLYIGRQIAAAHGGTLTVESTPDQGSTFILELPLRAGGASNATA
jgi:signal transduction histidine kinase